VGGDARQLPAQGLGRRRGDADQERVVQARYSRRDFYPQEIRLLHRIWRRVQAALQRMRAA
jgi:hypothetical protein